LNKNDKIGEMRWEEYGACLEEATGTKRLSVTDIKERGHLAEIVNEGILVLNES
jgi:hypothetical protein